MVQQPSHETVSILYELDLGQHTLFIMSDGGIDLLANDEQTPSLADNGMSLDSDETYRLPISLQEQFKHKGCTSIRRLLTGMVYRCAGAYSQSLLVNHTTILRRRHHQPNAQEQIIGIRRLKLQEENSVKP